MGKIQAAKDAWIFLPDGTNLFDREFREGALEVAHERGFSRIRFASEEDILARCMDTDLFRRGRMGIIGHIRTPRLQRAIARRKVPAILLGEESVETWRKTMGGRVTICSVDNFGIGQMAADYLYGQERFASFVYADGLKADWYDWWTNRRYDAFVRTIREHGYTGEIPRFSTLDTMPDVNATRFCKLVKSLPKPLAVFAANDRIAREIIVFAELARLTIPDELAVLGVDDESNICTTSPTAISSIKIEHHRLGRTAFGLMIHMLEGEPNRDKVILCPPVRVIERASTRRRDPEDAFVARAAEHIRRASLSKLNVAAVVSACGASRSYVEKRFKRETGRTILEAINSRILDETKKALLDTDLPISLIAQQAGFSSSTGLCALFRRVCGMSMTDFRNSKRMKHCDD